MSHGRYANRALLAACWLFGSAWLSFAPKGAAQDDDGPAYSYYEATAVAGKSLKSILVGASPIHRDGRVFYGYTEWHVRWRLWWTNGSSGACKMTKVLTHVDATITLPKLINGTPSQLNQFYALLSALRVHELGHYAIAKDAATEIESEIGAMPEMEGCSALVKAANDLGQRTLNDYRLKEKQYDVDTQHGRTQGAWIE
jgi:predicted secreted Zn-dependent protease